MTAWVELQIETEPEAAELVATAVAPLTGGVELRDSDTLVATAPGRQAVVVVCSPHDEDAVLAAAEDALAAARTAGATVDPVAVRRRLADEDEWRDKWKQFFRTTRVGRRFLVRPSWDPAEVAAPARFLIDLDPGRAFGTGAHPSTQLAIRFAEEIADGRPALERFLDLGCGSGILAIVAGRLWPKARGMAVDVDPEATACARENFGRNHLETVETVTGTLARVEGTFDLVLANIQADVLMALAAEMRARLADEGRLVLSGLLISDLPEVLVELQRVGLRLVARAEEGEWAALMLGR